MKFSIAIKTGLISLLIAGLGILGISYISFKEAGDLLQNQSLINLTEGLRKESNTLQNSFKIIREDVLFLSESPPVRGIIRASESNGYDIQENTAEKTWKKRLTTIFATVINQRSYYTQIRFIGNDNSGMELVRVDKKGDNVIAVEGVSLQKKGEASYFKKASSLNEKQVYFSKLNLNRENYKIQIPYQLVIRVAVPVYDKNNGKQFGIVIINADFNKMATSLHSPPENIFYFVADSSGEYIIHPDETKRYAFEFGRSARYQVDYPIEKKLEEQLVNNRNENFNFIKDDAGISINHVSLDTLNPDRKLTLGAVAKHSVIHATTRDLQSRLVILTIIIIAIIGVINTWAMRMLTKPIVKLKQVADRISSGEEDVTVPRMGKDEIGDLAVSMGTMLGKLSSSRANLMQMTNTLDAKVKRRTEELTIANKELESEITERMKTEEARSVAEIALQKETKYIRLLQEITAMANEANS
ncbi:MAG: HAMP domain-containing protein, partial [Candidatus Scalindua sp.]|nr:HAMP domain-containing protein [Candidatus Scalindua sp.]